MLLTGGGATAYNDGGLATGRAAQGGGAPGVSISAIVKYARCTRALTMSGIFTRLVKLRIDVPVLDAGTGKQYARHACEDAVKNG